MTVLRWVENLEMEFSVGTMSKIVHFRAVVGCGTQLPARLTGHVRAGRGNSSRTCPFLSPIRASAGRPNVLIGTKASDVHHCKPPTVRQS